MMEEKEFIQWEYQCRRCGTVSKVGNVFPENSGIVRMSATINKFLDTLSVMTDEKDAPLLMIMHRCKDGMGISDLLGYTKVKESKPKKIEKYYYKTAPEPPDTTCLEPCKVKDNGIMIGSATCSECEFCVESNVDEEWIKCRIINEALS